MQSVQCEGQNVQCVAPPVYRAVFAACGVCCTPCAKGKGVVGRVCCGAVLGRSARMAVCNGPIATSSVLMLRRGRVLAPNTHNPSASGATTTMGRSGPTGEGGGLHMESKHPQALLWGGGYEGLL